jgi:hypothetical protein
MSGYPAVYNPVVANPNDGENITLCKILDTLSTAAGQEGTPQTGAIATTTGSYVITCTDYSTIAFSSTAASSGTITIQGSVDGVNFFNTTYVALASGGISANFNASTATMGQINSVGLTSIKFLASNLVGSITISAIGSIAVSNVMLDNSIPAGNNLIGSVKDHNSAASGSTFFNDTTARTGSWYSIQVLAAAVFTTLTDSTRDGTAVSTFSFPAGTIFFGNFTAITLASGTIIAYKS